MFIWKTINPIYVLRGYVCYFCDLQSKKFAKLLYCGPWKYATIFDILFLCMYIVRLNQICDKNLKTLV